MYEDIIHPPVPSGKLTELWEITIFICKSTINCNFQ